MMQNLTRREIDTRLSFMASKINYYLCTRDAESMELRATHPAKQPMQYRHRLENVRNLHVLAEVYSIVYARLLDMRDTAQR